MKNIKVTFVALLIIGLISFIAWGGWMLKRTINYKWAYQDQVQAEIQKAIKPLSDRIIVLEFQVKTNR